MELFLLLIVIPFIGVLCFMNFVELLKKLKNGKNPHNQIILGAFLLFIFISSWMFGLIILIES